MQTEAIRRAFRTRPFRPLTIVMNNGDRFRCPSPEVFVSDVWVVINDEDGLPTILDPDSIAEIRATDGRRPAARRRSPG